MSSNETVLNTGNQAIINFNTQKMFVWGNRFDKANFTAEYGGSTLAEGTVMGRIAATGELIPLESDASDGSQFPVGVLAADIIVESEETVEVPICVSGDVVSSKLIFVKDGDDLDTVVDGRQLRDRMAADTVGIKLVGSTDMTDYDNQ